MPSEQERHETTAEMAARMAAQVADDQRVLAEAREQIEQRETTDGERQALREAKAAAERSSAPEVIWAVPWGGWKGNRGMIAVEDREYWSLLSKPVREPVAYVRKDVAVPAVEELAGMVGAAIHAAPSGPSLTLSPAQIAEGVHRMLLERAACSEGDNDGEG